MFGILQSPSYKRYKINKMGPTHVSAISESSAYMDLDDPREEIAERDLAVGYDR